MLGSLALHPGGDRGAELIQLSREKVIHALHNDKFVLPRQGAHQLAKPRDVAELVVRSLDKELGLGTRMQVGEAGVVHWRADSNKRGDASILASHAKSHPAAKTEAGQHQLRARKFRGEKIESGAHILPFADAPIVHSRAEARAAKIEAQDRQSQGVERFRSLINDFVVQRAAKERMGMADQSGEQRLFSKARSPENSLKLSRRAG